ncbi:tRNA (guanosine(46)-N7)-methyltransferase TrmB [Hymenobacter sp. PAMC 26628]|uniref:tRNA (guanosine(46)-N7)-methyltransferase TrmB n=1 Tax=Hymenobacter sp. PAMC 26628 TaxID=1484118 RepID=UPI0007705093|nr:tRNA (guanosine(46)-N7)-methyltransferase TrmB [Hymenobacter sp. PAMC 26628]AMJ65603.1 tRNA (guanine-N7)-methyltransferase [Hymenobacter sp. PAMC 26628]
MPRVKLHRFADNATRPDVIEPGKPEFETLGGRWRADFFHNDHPLTLEMGCGKGEYTVGLAQRHPQRNFLGLDIKGERLWSGSTRAAALGLANVGFVRARAEALTAQFSTGELSEIWITFPDPRPRDRDIKRRLTSPRFLNQYHELLAPGAPLHLKTDNDGLFDYTLEILAARPGAAVDVQTRDLYAEEGPGFAEAQAIQTNFEGKYRAVGVPIKYLRFRLS